MFSGIVEDIGTIKRKTAQGEGMMFEVDSRLPGAEIRLGDSIAVNGCCLTVAQKSPHGFEFFVSHESLAKTNLGELLPGSTVNLERSLALGARLDGHLVQGHVEDTGALMGRVQRGDSLEIQVRLPAAFQPLVIVKGSIALDGVSLTINSVVDQAQAVVIGVNLIPFTLSKTTLGSKPIGAKINIESDILGRYVQRIAELDR